MTLRTITALLISALFLAAPLVIPHANAAVTCEKNVSSWSPALGATLTATAYACPSLTGGRYTGVEHTVTTTVTGSGFAIEGGYYAWTGYYYSSFTTYSKIYYHQKSSFGSLNNDQIILTFNFNRAPNWIYTVNSLTAVYLPTGEKHTVYAFSFDCTYPAC